MADKEHRLDYHEGQIKDLKERLKNQEEKTTEDRLRFLEDILLEFMAEYHRERREMDKQLDQINSKLDKWTGSFQVIIWMIAIGLPSTGALVTLANYFL